jgi:hypothetical protein
VIESTDSIIANEAKEVADVNADISPGDWKDGSDNNIKEIHK